MADNDLLKGILSGTKPKPPPQPVEEAEDYVPPDLGGEYLAYGHFRSRHMPCLHLYFNAAERKAHGKKKRQLQYVNLESDDAESGFADDGRSFSLVFVTSSCRLRLTVRGRNLETIYDLISFHRLAWMRSIDAGRDIKGAVPDDRPVITSLTLVPIEEEE